jgi:RNA polymerase sigma-70 factor (ECF subfamily)
MPQTDERELIERCRAGGDAAFAELVDRYKDLVFGVVSRSIPDRTRAEDVAQEVFLRIHRGLPYFRGEAKLSTWIYRIVLNLCTQERGRDRPIEVPLDPANAGREDDRRPAMQIGAVPRTLSDLELRDRLDKALARLPETYRVLVTAHYLQGVSYEQLADITESPLGTVKTHLYRAKRLLRELLSTELA